ncbi:diacylglycerol/lipid kinase family protein [Sutcliffiella halmapala]|uniref:diacylglycerol/lipid kinase family protein n=1 Tax=Sutcliffiella halmapala TaxID=79882 RepID=UPI000995927A|nr:diacylglycerol kinase family protein [Sutcliffiella halmapala]
MYYFIVNKTSGNGKGWRVWGNVENLLKKRSISYKVVFTEGSDRDADLVESISPFELKAIIVVGGDGTIHGVANSLVHKKIPLGIIPAGSGNDFARSLQIPMNYVEALERILVGSIKEIDIGKVGEEYYITIAGIGFDGKVAQVTNESKSKKLLNKLNLGSLAYVYSLIKVLFTYKPTTVKLKIDRVEKIYHDVWMISVANLPFYGGGIKICPDAKADDGLLDLCIVHGVGRWELLLVFPRAFSGSHITHRNVTIQKGKDIILEPYDELTIQCDGEIIKQQRIALTIEEKALFIL